MVDYSDLIARLREALDRIQEDNRPLPWVVHSGCSYRRIASEPTRENPRRFPDGNVLHATKCWHDGHPDLSMGESQLNALVSIVNSIPEAATALEALSARERVLRASLQTLADDEAAYRRAHDLYGADDIRTGRAWDVMRRSGDRARTALTDGAHCAPEGQR